MQCVINLQDWVTYDQTIFTLLCDSIQVTIASLKKYSKTRRLLIIDNIITTIRNAYLGETNAVDKYIIS